MLNSEELINKVKGYNKFLNPEKLNKAYDFAVKAHSNQKRASGDPYSVHPIEVANILTDLKLDSATITTGLLHDTIEDTYATYETIKGEFGSEVADLVDGVTKISVLENTASANSKAENFINLRNDRNKILQNASKTKNNARNQLLKNLNPILKEFMREKNIRMVLDKKDLILADESLDITDDIMKIFNNKVKSIKIQ